MAGNTKVPDKKTVVAIIIIAVLVIAAIVGTVAFLKNRGTTEATDLASYNEQTTGTTQEEQTTTDTQEQSGEPATESAEEQTTEGTEPATTEPTQTADTDTTTAGGNQGTGATGTTAGGTTTTTDNIQDTTILREETVTTPTHAEDRIWEPRELQASFASAYSNIDSVEPTNITVTKKAETQSGSTLVQAGEEITYTITVKNNTEEKIERIYVTDVIPEGTTYVEPEEEISNLTEFRDEQGKVTSLRWLVDVEPTIDGTEGITTVSFKVKVKDDATGTISNLAIANGEESNEGEPVKHSVITVAKANTLESETVKPGDTFDYTITVKNTGEVEGTVTVTDKVPEQLEIKGTTPEATITENKVDFGNVEVKPGELVILTIRVEVKDDATGDIHNTAIVNGNEVEDPETIKTVNITAVKENNEADGVVKPGDTFDYTITLTNSGNAAGTVTVTDEIPGQLEIKGTTPEATITENKVDFGSVTVEPGTPVILTINVEVRENATGTIQNAATVDGEDVEDPEEIKTVNITAVKENNETDGVVKPGDTFDYTITLTNSGNAEGTVPVIDEVPEGLKVTGAEPEATITGNTVDFGNVTVPAEGTTTLTIHVEVEEDATGTIQNAATVDGEDVEDPEIINISNINIEKGVAELKEGAFTILSDEALDSTIYEVGDTVWYAIKVTNNGEVRDSVTVTDTLVAGLTYAGEAKVNDAETNATGVTVNGQTITWETTLEKNETKTLYIKATVNSNAISGEPISSEITGETTDWWDTNNSNKPIGSQEQTAQLFIRLDGKILEDDENEGHDTDEYTPCVGTVNLTQKNLDNDRYTTNKNAIKIGTGTTPTTVEEYASLNYRIFQYIVDGTDLETIANAINNGNYQDPDGNKVTFNPEEEMIVCYVLKYEDDGYHIDAVIRDRVQTRVDLYKVGNTATVNDKTSSVDINVSTTTELTDYTVEKQWNDAGKESERPEIDVNLYDNQGNLKENAELNKDNNWTYTFKNLDKKDSNGNDIQYTAKEVSFDIENGSTTIFDEGDTNGNYIVSYNTEAGKTVITNTYSQPNITVEKTQKVENDKTTVEYSDEITYTITATNNGTAAGSVTIKDDLPENTTLKPDTAVNVVVKTIDGKATEVPATTITIDELKAGYTTTVAKGRKVEVSFTVVVNDGYAGDVVENTANYQKDGEEEKQTDTVTSKIEDTVNVVTTTTTEQSQGQKVILLLDYSTSMKENIGSGWNSTSKLKSMKTAVNTFLNDFLPNGTKNQVMVIPYAYDTFNRICNFTSNREIVSNFVNNTNMESGTNIDAALSEAYKYIDENTSIILMTDGVPSRYRDDWSGEAVRLGDGDTYNKTCGDQAIAAANRIKDNKGAKIYSIGFGLDSLGNWDGTRTKAKQMMETIASDTEYNTDGTVKTQYYYDSYDEESLKDAFETISISITVNNDPVPMETQDGKITLTSGFEVGQNVEFYYTENYNPDNVEGSTPYEIIPWNEFINKSYVEYNETEGTLSLDLGAYMESKQMEPNEEITIRFVRAITAQTRIVPANILSLAITGIEDETINEKTVSTYEEKINKAEASKDTENTQPTDTNKPENVETTKPDNAAGNVEDNTENTTEGENTTEEENTTDQEETDMPTVEEQPEQPENPTTETPVESENTIQETTSNIDMQKTE